MTRKETIELNGKKPIENGELSEPHEEQRSGKESSREVAGIPTKLMEGSVTHAFGSSSRYASTTLEVGLLRDLSLGLLNFPSLVSFDGALSRTVFENTSLLHPFLAVLSGPKRCGYKGHTAQ